MSGQVRDPREAVPHPADWAQYHEWLENGREGLEGKWITLCPECGPHVEPDEDGCCGTCGADACGPGVEWALAEIQRLRRAGYVAAMAVLQSNAWPSADEELTEAVRTLTGDDR